MLTASSVLPNRSPGLHLLYCGLGNDFVNRVDYLGLNEWCKYFCMRLMTAGDTFMCTLTLENCPCGKHCKPGPVYTIIPGCWYIWKFIYTSPCPFWDA